MEKLGVNQIREKYLQFFQGKDHLRLPSFSLVPEHDKSLLLINAGMAPLKPYFTGQATPPSKRVVTCQKCIRTGDIENVGKTARHATFFEMLGNFSFGDYFKEEVIPWAWQFVTQVLNIPADRLYVTVYQDDDEAYNIWREKIGVPEGRIFRMGKASNFWELSLGPCGPCSEIYYDRGAQYGMDDFLASEEAGEDRYIEIWNLVFTQFNKSEDGTYSDLASTNIDTGMGLERMAMVMQGETSIHDIDTMKAIRNEVCAVSGTEYTATPNGKKDISIRLITDHARSITFMISDGILPSNEGRGYVLRRLLRRAARHGRLLGIDSKFLNKLVAIVIANFREAYPELAEKQDYIYKLVEQEEQRFHETLDGGIDQLRKHMDELKKAGNTVLEGAAAFKLHDTFGFPLELTREILEEEGLAVDEEGFATEMEAQRNRARAAREDAGFTGDVAWFFEHAEKSHPAEFVGYDSLAVNDAKILHISYNNNEIAVVVDKTPVYAESGGQMADTATIITETGEMTVKDCRKAPNGQFAHIGSIARGEIKEGQTAKIKIDTQKRLDTARNHTATHLLHHALRHVLGSHVQQAGSLVSADRLRFDFAHFAPTTPEELANIENMVNISIFSNIPVSSDEMPIADAKARGAIALFGEKYGENVRVVSTGDSVELCGGTHLSSTSQIGTFKILSESGIAAGVRRIEAIVGSAALAHYKQVESKLAEIAAFLKTPADNVINRIEQLTAAAKDAERKLAKQRQADANSSVDEILASKAEIGGICVVSALLPDVDVEALRNLSDTLMSKLGSGVVMLAGTHESKANILIRATDDVVKSGIHCGNLIKAAATAAGGGGGGRPNMAQAGIKDATKAQVALDAAKTAINS